jgi:hypothetical protein
MIYKSKLTTNSISHIKLTLPSLTLTKIDSYYIKKNLVCLFNNQHLIHY